MSLRTVRSLFLLAGLAGAAVLPASAQPAFQVADINPAAETFIHPALLGESLVAVGSTMYFAADDGPEGLELWKTDGTAEGTVLVKDICPGYCWSRPFLFKTVGGLLYFTAEDGSHGRELWVSDGTAAGTRMVKDIAPGMATGATQFAPLLAVGDTVFFSARDGVHGDEIWKSDGTEAGTQMVADIRPGPADSSPVVRAVSGTQVFFIANDGIHGEEPWVSDGTATGTVLIKDVRPGTGGSVFPFPTGAFSVEWLAGSGGQLLFLADDGIHGAEPWVSDGTEDGTALLADLLAGPEGSCAQSFTEMGGNVYFAAKSTTGLELWKTGGIPGDPVQVKEIRPDTNSGPFELRAVGSLLYFPGHDAVHGRELWKSDGTTAGTQLVKDLLPGADGALPPRSFYRFGELNGFLVFVAVDGEHVSLWRSDGTQTGTLPLARLSSPVPEEFTASIPGLVSAGGALYFRVFDLPSSLDLWRSDGTAAGTNPVQDLRGATDSLAMFYNGLVSGTRSFVFHRGSLLFQANDGESGAELWASDGTAGGTRLLADAAPGEESSYPYQLTELGGVTLFTAGDPLWRTDGTPAGTARLGSGPTTRDDELTRFGGRVYFTRDETWFGRELWRSDGTTGGTVRVTDIRFGADSSYPVDLTVSGGRLFFTASDRAAPGPFGAADDELWVTDGTQAGTSRVRDIEPGVGASGPYQLTDVAGTLFFFATTSAAGRELWKSDGTEAGTILVRDIQPGPDSSRPRFPWEGISLGSTFYFVANGGTSGDELWKSDGTEAGTVLVKDIFPGAGGSEPTDLTRVRNRLYLVADDGVHGRELWVTDGTDAGTVLVADLVPGPETSLPQELAAMGHVLLFSAWDSTHGREPWKSDGTAAGTVRVDDIASGPVSSSPVQFTAGFPNVYFGATDGATGFEPWAFPRSLLGSTFGDVPVNFWAFRWVEALADAGITDGCGSGDFCPDQAVSRAAASVFLVRAARGEAFTPPPATGTLFGDVPAGYWAAAWIEQLAADGVTGGCGNGNFCPEDPVTRAQLAVLLLRARFGSAFLPPAGTGTVFADVPAGYWARDWIEHLVALGVTGGCGNGNYCPERPVTRAELAVFVARAFELPTP